MSNTPKEKRKKMLSATSRKFDKHSFETKEKDNDNNDDDEEEEEILPEVGYLRILSTNKPEWLYIACKCQ